VHVVLNRGSRRAIPRASRHQTPPRVLTPGANAPRVQLRSPSSSTSCDVSRTTRRCLLVALLLVSSGCESFEPAQNAEIFAVCCAGFGACVPRGLVPSNLSSHLARAECGEALLCVPRAAVEDAAYQPVPCAVAAGVEGRCLLACLPEVASIAKALGQSSCEAGELCVPCVAGVPCQ
jgi:hypothetical protein